MGVFWGLKGMGEAEGARSVCVENLQNCLDSTACQCHRRLPVL